MAPASASATARVRVYVGGLPADVSESELQERFSRFVASGSSCRLERVELLPPKGLDALNADTKHRGFAYLTLIGDAAPEVIEKLVKTYHKTKWRGSVLRVEQAKPDFMERLQQEWQEQRELQQIQSAAMAEARGLTTAGVERDLEELEINISGVVFSGKKRTTFDYEDIDFEMAFAPKPAKVAAVAVPVNGYSGASDEEMSETETENSDDEERDGGPSDVAEKEVEDDDDADYWATSGDESDIATPENGDAARVDATSSSDEQSEEEEDGSDEDGEESEDDNEEEAPVEDAVAVDDVEAFVQQMMEQEKQEQQSSTPASKTVAPAKVSSTNNAQVDEDGVEAYVQQVEREEANARRIAALEAKMKQKQQQQATTAVKIDLSAKSNKKITFDDSGNEQEENDDDQDNEAGGSGAITNWLDSSDDEGDDNDGNYGELRDGSDNEDDDAKKRKRRNAFEFGGDDDENNEDAKAFAVRPEFLGERGKKLFELQKRFGGDQRFRMDARFIDDEENEYGGTDGLLPDEDDEQVIAAIADGPTGELQTFQDEDGEDQAAANESEWMREQDLALSVIAELFPDVDIENIKYRMRVKVKKDPIKEASWMGQMKRYDPRDIHARHAYEIPIEDKKKTKQSGSANNGGDDSDDEAEASNVDAEKKKARDEKEVLIGGDRFFSTSSALGSLFTRVRKNSEDGVAGEAALDGVFGFSRGFDAAADADTTSGDAAEKSEDAAAPGAGAATFKLSSLFDFPVEEDKEKNSRLAAMGEKLFEEDNDDDEGDKPWHFTQSFFSEERDDVRMDTDNEDEDGEEDAEDAAEDEQDGKKKKKKVLKKSLTEFLEFGKTFVCPQDGSTNQKSKEWTEKRRKLTMDFKRKRKDALRNKKKTQQRLQKQHASKKQKMVR